jgi:hypothetical protein
MAETRIDHNRKSGQFVVYRYGGWGGSSFVATFGTLAAARAAYPQAHLESGLLADAPTATGASIWDVQPLAPLATEGGPLATGGPTIPQTSRAKWVATTAVLLIALIVLGILWNGDHSNLTTRVGELSSQVSSTSSMLADTQAQLDSAKREALHPTLVTWNVPGSIGPNSWREGSVPDTFTFHLRFTANSEVFFAFLTLGEYALFTQCPNYVDAIDRSFNRLAAGCIDYWVMKNHPYTDRVGTFAANVNASFDFHYAEGCASWVLVLMPLKAGVTLTITPHVAVTYNPASAPTPGCT